VGRKMEDRMLGLGVRTINDLSKLDVQKLIRVFGLKLGVYFHNASNGINDEPVKERGEVKSFSRISTLKKDTRDINFIFEKSTQLCEEVYSRLSEAGIGFKTIGVLLVTSDMGVHSRSKTFNKPSEEFEVIKITVKELIEQFLYETDESIRRVGVKLSNFEKHRDQKRLTDFIGLQREEKAKQ
jgi:nucleotidyltransferase/DNA polymerase involved in DNA repair